MQIDSESRCSTGPPRTLEPANTSRRHKTLTAANLYCQKRTDWCVKNVYNSLPAHTLKTCMPLVMSQQTRFLFTWTHQQNTINGTMTMTNIGVRAEHMSSTFSVYQKVRIHMSILSGMWESIASTSLLKRFSNRPVGVLSKKVCGARRTP